MEKNKLQILDLRLKELLDRFSQNLDPSIHKEKERLLSYFDQDFVGKRSIQHILRILTAQYLNKKKLLGAVYLASKTRCLKLRIMPTKLEFPFASKWVIGILVQIALNNRYELFDQEQLLKAVQKFMPQLRIVKGSVYMFQGPNDTVKTVYAEFEKIGNQLFTLAEIKILKTSLEDELLLRIERLVPAVFMTRNQEEVLRNILTLSQEIEYVTDLPQVMISFETQTAEELVFTLICVSPENPDRISIDALLKQKSSSISQWVLERKQLVKYLDQHQPIFAYIFRVLLTPHPTILRSDNSLNFFAARQKIGNFLKEAIGEFRDFNGGILIKQEETLDSLKNALPGITHESIENVFYSIAPIEMQAILPLSVLKDLFQLFQSVAEMPLSDSCDYVLKSREKDHLFLVMVRIPNGSFYELAKDHLLSFDLPEIKQASLTLSLKDSHFFGYLLETDNGSLKNRFFESLEKLLLFWKEEVKKYQVLRLPLENPIPSLDPRIGGDGVSATILKMLFEGLMRIGPKGNLEKCIAEHIDISPDLKTYIFRLRPTVWSNGSPLTSHDFEYAWKKILSPRFDTAFAYLFHMIKNAKLAKKGILPMSDVGIKALDDYTLRIDLETPSPNFLEFLAHPLFSPVCRQLDTLEPNWPFEEGAHYICNGAFKIEKNHKDTSYSLVKNPFYWEKERIHLDSIVFTSSHFSQTYELFTQNKIHLIGTPWGTWDSNFKLGENDDTIIYPDQGLYWCVCNTNHPFLKNSKIRKALALAIDRIKLIEHIHYFKKPAYSPLPVSHSQIPQPALFETENEKDLFREGLEELGYSQSETPTLTISFTGRTIFGKSCAEFISSQWKQKLGLNTTIQGFEFKTLFSKLTAGDFHLVLIRWQPWVNDSFYTLNFFSQPEEPLNFSKWSHPELQRLLHEAKLETDDDKRKLLLYRVEEILINEMPIIPLFETCLQYMKKKSLQLIPNHTLIDFKWARFI
ncbi:MAG TPA: peptide ABC transporter substrate-binding protein [Rhabdochlamydiaceae bacterium]|nr:peptide ABC transporter substrate-binding protein [Rhabdochlamydiaceae bacterium]